MRMTTNLPDSLNRHVNFPELIYQAVGRHWRCGNEQNKPGEPASLDGDQHRVKQMQ